MNKTTKNGNGTHTAGKNRIKHVVNSRGVQRAAPVEHEDAGHLSEKAEAARMRSLM